MKTTIAFILLLLSGCMGKGSPVNVSGAKDDFEVTRLFEKDGVTVYRFYDGGYYRYFASRGETMTDIYSGKTRKQENIPTVTR